jgi:hypothetical protein
MPSQEALLRWSKVTSIGVLFQFSKRWSALASHLTAVALSERGKDKHVERAGLRFPKYVESPPQVCGLRRGDDAHWHDARGRNGASSQSFPLRTMQARRVGVSAKPPQLAAGFFHLDQACDVANSDDVPSRAPVFHGSMRIKVPNARRRA